MEPLFVYVFLLSFDMSKLWVGNIPPQLSKAEVIEELACYNIRVKDVDIIPRGGGQTSYGILFFASPELAMNALKKDAHWSSGSYILLRVATEKPYDKRRKVFAGVCWGDRRHLLADRPAGVQGFIVACNRAAGQPQ